MNPLRKLEKNCWGEVLLAYGWLRNESSLEKLSRRFPAERLELVEDFARELQSLESREARARCKAMLEQAGLGSLLERLRL